MSAQPKVMKQVDDDELQHKVQVDKEEKKYKPPSIFEDYKKKQGVKKKMAVAKAKSGHYSQTKQARILGTGVFGGD
jgi:hypothetical protein